MKKILIALVIVTCLTTSSIDAEQKFVLFTMPKTGTYLMRGLLEKLSEKQWKWGLSALSISHHLFTEEEYERVCSEPSRLVVHPNLDDVSRDHFLKTLKRLDKRGLFFACHAPYSEKLESVLRQHGYKVFFILRDPRDYVVSLAHFQDKVKNWRYRNSSLVWLEIKPGMTFDQVLETAIRGSYWFNGAKMLVEVYTPWLKSDICCSVRFEDLVGNNPVKRLEALHVIADGLDISASDKYLLQVFQQIYGHSATFRRRKSGEWKEHFTPQHKTLFKQELGDKLIELGYEANLAW